MFWMFWLLWGSRGANTCGAMALMADPRVAGAAVLGTAKLDTAGPRVMLAVLGDSGLTGLAGTEAGVWFVERGLAVVTGATPALLPLTVPAVCIDVLTAEGLP